MTDDHVVVVGAGLAGLAAAAAVLECGVDVVVQEAGAAPGGATIESAGWIWCYRDRAAWRVHAPTASPTVTALIHERLDVELAWLLDDMGVTALATSTGRDFTDGVRVDPCEVVDRLVARIGADRIRTRARVTEHVGTEPLVLAAGGYGSDFARIADECGASDTAAGHWVRRPSSVSLGDGIALGIAAGGARSHSDGDCLVRLTVAEPERVRDLLSAISELLAPGATLLSVTGEHLQHRPDDWSNAHRLRALQIEHGGGFLHLPAELLQRAVHSGTINEIVDALERRTDHVTRDVDGSVRIAVCAGITHTWCGLDIDRDARVVGASTPVFAAGCDAAGSGHGGTASGLAQALVLGRRAGVMAARQLVGTDRPRLPT